MLVRKKAPGPLAAVWLLAGLLSPASVDGQNLLSNPGFEDPAVPEDNPLGWLEYDIGDEISGWTVEAPAAGPGEPPEWSPDKSHDGVDLHARQLTTLWTCAEGLQALDLNGHSSSAVSQEVDLDEGRWYALRFSMSANLACAPSTVILQVHFGGELVTIESFETAGWTFDDMGWEIREELLTGLSVPSRLQFSSLTPGGCGPAIDALELLPTWDLGDAPTSDSASSPLGGPIFGPAHAVGPESSLYLGSCVDAETDLLAPLDGLGDDLDPGLATVGTCSSSGDEDGVVAGPLAACGLQELTVTASAPGFLDAWIDFDGDGLFTTGSEQIFAAQALEAGSQTLSVSVPCQAIEGETFARFRFSSTGGLDPNGLAANGEVEDHVVFLVGPEPVPEIPTLGTWGLLILLFLLAVLGTRLLSTHREGAARN